MPALINVSDGVTPLVSQMLEFPHWSDLMSLAGFLKCLCVCVSDELRDRRRCFLSTCLESFDPTQPISDTVPLNPSTAVLPQHNAEAKDRCSIYNLLQLPNKYRWVLFLKNIVKMYT